MLITGELVAVGYARVSTEEQANLGTSLAVQEDRIRAFCRAKGWRLLRVYADGGESAKTLERPALQSLINDLQPEHVDIVVIARLDRLTRSVRDLGVLVDDVLVGVALASVAESIDTSNANGRMVLNLLGTVAQWERETISERTSVGMRFRRDVEGRWIGRIGYGFRIDQETGRLVEDEDEMKAIAAMKRSRRRGKSLRSIAEHHGVSAALVHKIVNTDLRKLKAATRTGSVPTRTAASA